MQKEGSKFNSELEISESVAEKIMKCRPRVLKAVKSFIGSESIGDPENIVSEAIAKGLSNYDKLDDKTKLTSWLCTIALNLARDEASKISRRPIEEVSLEELSKKLKTDDITQADIPGAEWLSRKEEDPEAILLKNENSDYVAEAMNVLKPDQKQVVEMYYFRGMQTPQIARLLGLEESSVRVKLKRSLEVISHRLKFLKKKPL